MSLNSLGLGIVFHVQDLASAAITKIGKHLGFLNRKATAAGAAFKDAAKTFAFGGSLMAAGATGFRALAPAIKANDELEAAIAKVAVRTTEALFPQKEMRRQAEELAQQFGKMPVDEANAMAKAVALGARDSSSALTMMTAANQLAIAGGAKLEQTVEAIGGTLNAYGLDVSHASEVSDAFFTAVTSGNKKVDELATQIGRVAPIAATMGISIQETLGAIAAMTEKGIKARQAVSGLSSALSNIMHPSKQARLEASKLGIAFDAKTLREKGLHKFFGDIIHSSKFTVDSLKELFRNQQGINAMAALANKNGAVFDEMLEKMAHSAGSTSRGFGIMSATLKQLENRIESAKKVSAGIIGEALSPLVRIVRIVELVILEVFNAIPKPILSFVAILFALASAATIVVGAIIAFKAAAAIFAMVWPFIGGAVMGAIVTFGWVVLAVLAVVAVFYILKEAVDRNIGGIANLIERTFNKIALIFDGLKQAFSKGEFSGAIMDELDRAENSGIKSFVIKLYAYGYRIMQFFKGFAEAFDGVLSPLGQAFISIRTAFDIMVTRIAELFNLTDARAMGAGATWKMFGAIVGSVAAAIAQVMVWVVSVFVTSFSYAMEIISDIASAIKGVGEIIGGFFASVVGFLTGDWVMAWEGAKGLVVGIGGVIMSIVNAVVQGVAHLVDIAGGLVGYNFGVSKRAAYLEKTSNDYLDQTANGGDTGAALFRDNQSQQSRYAIYGARKDFAMPAMADAERGSALTAAAGAAITSDSSVNVTIELDGDVIGEHVDRRQNRMNTMRNGPIRRER